MKSGSVAHDGSVVLAVQRAAHVTVRELAAQLQGLGLTASEMNVLANLADGQRRTVSELGTAAGSRPTTLTGVLDRLERRGHITRGSRPGDRRAVLIALTPAGRTAARSIRRTLAELERRALGDLPPGALAGFHAVLHALMEASA